MGVAGLYPNTTQSQKAQQIMEEYIMAGNYEDYETVAERIVRIHTDRTDVRIHTTLLETVRNPQTLLPIQYICESSIYYGDVLMFIDVAEEMVGSSFVNKTSALENASTSATGRALSLAGYLGTDPNTKKPIRPTQQDMQKASRVAQPAPKTKREFTEGEIGLANAAFGQIASVTTKDELKAIYRINIDLLEVKVNGVTLLDAINNKAAGLK